MSETNSEKLYTLTEVAKKTGISMPTLQRYKKEYQSRIPSVGKGRTQRYPEESLDVFRELKKESMSRRGRPRKSAKRDGAVKKVSSRRGRPRKVAKKDSSSEELLTLTEISKQTKISYPTLLRYTKQYLAEIPHEGKGRKRRYHPEAVEVFKRLRSESGRGRKPGGAKRGRKPGRRGPGRPPGSGASASSADLTARLKELEKSHKELTKLIGRLEKKIERPFKVTLQRK